MQQRLRREEYFRSHRLTKVRVQAIRGDCSLSRACRNAAVRIPGGRFFERRKRGKQLAVHDPRRLLVQGNARGVSCQCSSQVWRSSHQQLDRQPRKQFGVMSFGGPEEFCPINRGQCSKSNKSNTCQVSGHPHRCFATTPPCSLCLQKCNPLR